MRSPSKYKNIVYWTGHSLHAAVVRLEDNSAVVADRMMFDEQVTTIDDIARQIKTFLRKTNRYPSIAVIGQRDVLWKRMTVPSHDDQEIGHMVRLSTKTMWDSDDFIFDYRVVQKCEDGHTEICLGIVHQDNLSGYCTLLRTIGIEPDQWAVSTIAIQAFAGQKADDLTGAEAILAGAALVPEEELFRWIPSDLRRERIDRRWGRQWMMFAVLIFGICILLSASAGLGYFQKSARLKALEQRMQTVRKRLDRVENLAQRMDDVRSRLERKIFMSDVLARLDKLREPGVYLNRVEGTTPDGLILQGMAPKEEEINNFQKQLIASRLFDEVTLQYTQRRQDQNEGAYFKIRCTWRTKS
jgi:Tfp pilus assembly protein PilN